MPKRIYVGNLPAKAEEKDLADFCSKFGTVLAVEIRGNRGFIELEGGPDIAAKALNGHVVGGNTLTAEIKVEHEGWEI